MGCSIYGKEKVRYTYNLVDDDVALVQDTLDWTVSDSLVDGTNNDRSITSTNTNTVQDIVYESSGAKSVHSEVQFNDGWDNVYTHETNLSVEALVYELPVLEFTWSPVEPTVLDTTVFTQLHNDTRDNDNVKGKILTVDIDYYNDGIDISGLSDTDSFSNQFTTKQDGIPVKLIANYWDGYENQTEELIKTLDMTNIPPVSDTTREDTGQCVPGFTWTAASTDDDDSVDTLTYLWKLSKQEDDSSWTEISSGAENTFTYPFQYEGNYKLVMRTTDGEGDFDEKVEEFPIVFDACGSGNGCSGVIKIESDRFEMISIPVRGRTVNDYFIAKVEEVTGLAASESIEFVKAYPSNTVSSGKYLGFVPGVTNPLSSNNFKLVDDDAGTEAHVPFFVRTKVLSAPIEIAWTTEDEVV